MSQRVTLNTKHAYFHQLALPLYSFSSIYATVKSWSTPKSKNKKQFKLWSPYRNTFNLFYIHMAFPLLLYAPVKRCNLPCMKILSDSCNGIWLSSWGDILSTATVPRPTPLSSLGRRAPWSGGHICPGVILVTLYTMTWFDNQLTVPSLNKTSGAQIPQKGVCEQCQHPTNLCCQTFGVKKCFCSKKIMIHCKYELFLENTMCL